MTEKDRNVIPEENSGESIYTEVVHDNRLSQVPETIIAWIKQAAETQNTHTHTLI